MQLTLGCSIFWKGQENSDESKESLDSPYHLDCGYLRIRTGLFLFAVTQVNNRLVQMENRFDKLFTELESRINTRFTELETRLDKRFNLIETRLEALNQNYIDHLAHHIGEKQ